jgi:serine phosphatase RsbU (regulator of sigma subunit)
VGDVAGHGLRAAAEMAQLRNSLRAYLFDDPSPARALERLDLMMAQVLPGTIATAVCAVIDTATAATRISHAGHVPSLVGDVAGAAFVSDAEGDALLGVGHGSRREQHVQLAPGAALVMYSDGLIEQRRRSIDDGLELLRRTVPKALAEADGTNLAAWIVEQVHDDRHVDDTSLLVLRRLD